MGEDSTGEGPDVDVGDPCDETSGVSGLFLRFGVKRQFRLLTHFEVPLPFPLDSSVGSFKWNRVVVGLPGTDGTSLPSRGDPSGLLRGTWVCMGFHRILGGPWTE